MKIKRNILARFLVLLAVAMGSILVGYAINDCTDNPYLGSWSCDLQGTTNAVGTLNYTAATICVGSTLAAPQFATNPTFNKGQETATQYHTCPVSSNPVYADVTFSAGTPYFIPLNVNWPPITGPFSTPGTYTYTAKFDATASANVCSNIIGVVIGTVTVTVNSSPSFTQQPTNQTVNAGGTATFVASATASTAVGYQWYFNTNTILPGATNATLVLTNAQPANAGSYSVTASNLCSTVASSNAFLTVNVTFSPPMIITQPTNQTVMQGSNVTFVVVATGASPLYYQWQENGRSLSNGGRVSGATSNVLTLTASKSWDAGIYTVMVTNSQGSVVSSYAVLRILAPSTVVAWGGNFYGQINVPAGLSNAVAAAANGGHSLALKIDGTVVAWGENDHGESSVPSGLTNAVAVAAGDYHSLALKSDGTVLAWGYNLYLQTNVPNSLSNVVAIAGGGFHNLALTGSGRVVSWGNGSSGLSSVPNLSNGVAIAAGYLHSLALKSDGTVVAWGDNSYGQTNIPPGLTNVLTIAAGDYNGLALKADGTVVVWGDNSYGETNVPPSATNVVAIAGGSGQCLVLRGDGKLVAWGNAPAIPPGLTNVVGIAGGGDHDLALGAVPPTILVQPVSQSAKSGNTVTFAVVASGTSPLSYQWTLNSIPVAGGTSSNLVLDPVGPSQVGTYAVKVSNSAGSVVSSNAVLTVKVPPSITLQPTNQMVILGGNATFSVTVDPACTLPLAYQWYFNGTNRLAGATNATLPLTNVQTTNGGSYLVVVTNSVGSATSAGAQLTVVVPPSITVQPTNSTAIQGNTATFSVTASGTTPLSYQWRRNGTGIAGATSAAFVKNSVQPSDAGNYTVVVTNWAGSVTSSVATLTVTIPPSILVQPTNQTVIPGANVTLVVSATGTTNLSYQWYFNATNRISNGTNALLSLPGVTTNNAGNYTVTVTNVAGSAVSSVATLTVIVPPSNPTIQPPSTNVVQGANATFSVTASGTPPFTYQWYLAGGIIPGATGSSYAKNVVQASDAGNYTVVVGNWGGSVTSSVAVLTVTVPPRITTQPASQVVAQGSNVTFSVTAAGTSLGYQWSFNGSKITGATASSFTTNNVQLANTGNYTVAITNSAGNVTSAAATLTVVAAGQVIVIGFNPQISSNNTVPLGTTVTLLATANPSNASFPAGSPVWTIASKPAGSNPTLPPAGSLTNSITCTNVGQFVVWAVCNTSSNSFTLTCVDPMADSDYDGVGDWQEILDGTDPNNPNSVLPRPLGSWRFDSANWAGLQGQIPLSFTNLISVPGVNLNGVMINTNKSAWLIYREADSQIANINCRKGSVSFWFRPDWSSGASGGPGSEARLIEFGTKGTTNGCWGLYINSQGTNLYFCTETNATGTAAAIQTNLNASISWVSNYWHMIALTYTTNSCRLLIDGQVAATNNSGVPTWPGLSVRTNGFCLGSSRGGTNQVHGRCDDLDTCDYQRSDDDCQHQYTTTCFSSIDAMILIDQSGSMGETNIYTGHTKIVDAKIASSNFISHLVWSQDQAGLISFDTNAYLRQVLTHNGASVSNALATLAPAGNTRIDIGISNAQFWVTNPTNRNPIALPIIVLLSDGSNNVAPATTPSVATMNSNTLYQASVAKTNGTHIVSVALGSDSDTNLMRSIASSTNLYFFATNSAALDGIYNLISGLLCRATNQAPSVQIISPLDYQVFNAPASIPIVASASDPQNSLVLVRFYDGANYLGAVTNSSGTTNALYTFNWLNVTNGGIHSLTAVATNEVGLNTTSSVVHVVLNYPPTVSAGPNLTLIWPEGSSSLTTNLNGSAADDGLPNGTLTNTWTVVSSNGLVTFANAKATNSSVTVYTNGIYVLQLTANDGAASASSTCTITVKRRPFVYITYPPTNSAFNAGASVSLAASAFDLDGSVTNVQFFDTFNGTTNSLGNALPSGNIGITNTYNLGWTNALPGTNTLTAVAMDNDGLQTTSAPVVVTVINPNPTVQILSPINQTFLARTRIPVTALAIPSSTNAPITQVQFYAGTNSAALQLVGATPNATQNVYQVTWRPAFGGTYTLMALAIDSRGTNVWSNPVTNTIRGLPSVTITAPTNSADFAGSPTNITISATATADHATITNVVFYSQGTGAIGATNAGSPYTIVRSFTNGTNVLSAQAVDSLGATGFSSTVTITVDPANQPPFVNPGPNQTNRLNSSVYLPGTAGDDGLPRGSTLKVWWTNWSSPPGSFVTFVNSNLASTAVSFSQTGVYVLQLSAFDSQYTTSSNVTITMLPTNQPPYVNAGPDQTIVWPAVGATNLIVHLTQVASDIASVDYFAPSNALLANDFQGLEIVSPTNAASRTLFNTISPGNEIHFAVARDTSGGFNIGDVFTGDGYSGEIVRIRPDGSIAGTNGQSGQAWVVLGDNGWVETAYVDLAGVFGGNLLVMTSSGNIWRINASGQATIVGSPPVYGEETLITVPNNIQKYGPWAGRILVGGGSGPGGIYAVDTNGVYTYYPGFIPESMRIIPANENFFAGDDNNKLWSAPASAFQAMIGDIIMADEGGGLYRVRWSGRAFEESLLTIDNYGADWEQVTFVPAGTGGVNGLGTTVQLNGYVTDDGIALANPITTWAQVTGPVPVAFTDSTKTNTTVTITVPGTNVLRLSANDGEFTRFNDVTIRIVQNQPPLVNAGTNQVLNGATATLTGTVTDDGWPSNQLTATWSQIAGPANGATFYPVAFAANSAALTAATFVTFNTNGTYVFQLTASDGQATSAGQVMVTTGQPQLTVTPAYAGLLATNTLQSFTAALVDATGVPIPNATVSFTVSGANPSGAPFSSSTDNYGRTTFSYTGTNVGRDFVQATYSFGSTNVVSPPAVVDWGLNLSCGATYQGAITQTGSVDVLVSPDLRYANYFFFNGQAGQQIDLSYANLDVYGDSLVVILLDSSYNIVDFSVNTSDSLIDTLPSSGNYLVEVTSFYNDSEVPNYSAYPIPYSLSLACDSSIPVPNIAVLLNGTNLPNGSLVLFGPTVTNVAVTNMLVVTNSGGASLQVSSRPLTGDFSAVLGAGSVPPGGSTSLQVVFNASSNEVSQDTLVLDNNSGAGPFGLSLLGAAFPPEGFPPSIQITNPPNQTTYLAPVNIPIAAAVTNGSDPISYVQFKAASTNGLVNIGIATNAPYSLTWTNVPSGIYALEATAVDVVGRSAISAPVYVQVVWYNDTNQITTTNLFYPVAANSINNVFYPQTQNIDSDGDNLTISAITKPQLGTNAIIYNGNGISYTPPNGLAAGYDQFSYQVTDGKGQFAWANISIGIYPPAMPYVVITSPTTSPNHFSTGAGTIVPITAHVTPSQFISKVDFLLGESVIGEVTNGNNGDYVLTNWVATYSACGCGINARATDVFNQVGASQLIYVDITNTAIINGPQPTTRLDYYVGSDGTNGIADLMTIRDGIINIYGAVYYPNVNTNVAWQLGVYTTDGSLVRDLTPPPHDINGACTNTVGASTLSGLLVSNCDLTMIANGVYDLILSGGGGLVQNETTVRFRLESSLKLGQFGFSQQDLVIPANGIPLSVTRTYNSLNQDKGDFGYGWTYTLSDMDVSINETRQDMMDDDDTVFNARSGGRRDVTLTLPNGQRTTFYYIPYPGTGAEYPNWVAAPGVTAYLAPGPGSASVAYYGTWQDPITGTSIPDELYDFPGFILTTQDGTQYVIKRQDLLDHTLPSGMEDIEVHAWGAPYLAQIIQPSLDTISITSTNIVHTNPQGVQTRQIVFQRNSYGLISSISDPNGQASGGPPALKYDYDFNLNLISVEKLTDRTGSGTYTTNFFVYTNFNFPHYITSMIDSRGVQVARQLYDDNGRLIGMIDANGKTNVFAYDLNAHTETAYDRLGYPTIYAYDSRGNVTNRVDALGRRIFRTYDDANNLTSVTDPSGHTYSYAYDTSGRRTSAVDPLGNTNTVLYDSNGRALKTTDPLGNTARFGYDQYGNVTNMFNALNESSSLIYNQNNKLSAFTDSLNHTNASLGYDAYGNVVNITNTASGLVEFLGYNANGKLAGSSNVWVNPNNPADVRLVSSQISYDAAGRRIGSIDPDGNQNTMAYIGNGKPSQLIGEYGRTNGWVYDARGKLIQTIHPNGNVTDMVYDDAGRMSVTDESHRPGDIVNGTRTTYDAVGQVIESEYLTNVVIAITTDASGISSSSVTSVGGVISTSTYGYDLCGRQIAVTNEFGSVTRYEYDNAGNQTAVIDALGNRTDNVYDPDGQLIATTNAVGQVTRFTYDPLGRVVRTDYPDGTFTADGYNSLGQHVAETNQAGLVTTYEYDPNDRLSAVVKPPVFDPETNAIVNPRWEFGYDAYGNVNLIRDPKGRVTRYTYDQLGRTLTYTMHMGQTANQLYDRFGRAYRKSDFIGQTNEFVYDALGRVGTNQFYAAGSSIATGAIVYAYDELDVPRQIVDPHGTNAFGYDNRERLSNAISPEGRVNYEYEPIADRRVRIYTAYSDLRYGYDELGRIKTVAVMMRDGLTLTTPEVTTNTYTKLGSLQDVYYPNGIHASYQYDSVMNRLTNLVYTGGSSALLAQYSYACNTNGQWRSTTEIQRQVNGTYVTNQLAWFYDNLGRLTNETCGSSVATLNYTNRYVYNLVGNRLWLTNIAGTVTTVLSYTYNDNDQLLQQVTSVNGGLSGSSTNWYDANGSLTNRSSATEQNSYGYDLQNRLVVATINRTDGGHQLAETVNFTCDYKGARVKVRWSRSIDGGAAVNGTNIFLNEPNSPSGMLQTLEEMPAIGAVPTASYTLGSRIVSQEKGGAISHLLPDGHGSTRQLADSNGSLTARYTYDAYGKGLDFTNGTQTPTATALLYSGERLDPDLQLYDLRARYYDPAVGRFNQIDPSSANQRSGANLYAYGADDPVNNIDPSGRYEIDVHQFLTRFLAQAVGFTSDEATQIGKEAQGPDYPADTRDAMAGGANICKNMENMKNYHFVSELHLEGMRQKVVADFNAGSLHDAGPYRNFGEYIHADEDTFAHSDCVGGRDFDAYYGDWLVMDNGGIFGHAFHGHDPDHTWNDVDKGMFMSMQLYHDMQQFVPRGRPHTPYPQIRRQIEDFMGYSPNVYKENKFTFFECENVTWQGYNDKVKLLNHAWHLPAVYLLGNPKNNWTPTFENVDGYAPGDPVGLQLSPVGRFVAEEFTAEILLDLAVDTMLDVMGD